MLLDHYHYTKVDSDNEMYEISKMYSHIRRISEYILEIRNLARVCNFGDSLNAMIQDHLVRGINDDQIQKHLLSKGDQLTLTKAVTLAKAKEAATKDSQLLQLQSASVQMVKDKRETQNVPCYCFAKPANCCCKTAKPVTYKEAL